MRKVEVWIGSILWGAMALLMPMAALEPVVVAPAAAQAPTAIVEACPEGGANLAMGCESIHL